MQTPHVTQITLENVAAPTLTVGKWDHQVNTVSYVTASYASPTTDNHEFGALARNVAIQVDAMARTLVEVK